MKLMSLFASGVIGASALLAAGCHERKHEVVVVKERPPVVVEQPRPVVVQPQPEVIVVREAPPPPHVEHRPPPPAAGYVWIGGYYTYSGHRYVWVPGRYAQPPRHGAHWEPDDWRHTDRGWEHQPGHWR